MSIPASKLPQVGTTIFSVMSQLAQECGAINLSQGFPDFSPPERLVERAAHHMRHGANQYAPMPGLPRLREAIAHKVHALYGRNTDPEREVTVTSGATEALMVSIQALVREGDEVVMFDPAYDSYDPAVRLAGGTPVHLSLTAPDYRIDFEALEQAIGPRTRMVIINSPHNPTGSLLAKEDLDRLAAILGPTDAVLLSDEVYEHIVFDGHEHASVLAHPDLHQRSVAVFSFGKTYHNTGWKVGYAVASPPLTAEIRKVHQFTTFCTATPLQHALADVMDEPGLYTSLGEFYESKRDFFARGLAGSRLDVLPCHGTYFQLVGYSQLSDLPDIEFARQLTEESGIAGIPISVFNADGRDERVLRFCFAKDETTLSRACEILSAL